MDVVLRGSLPSILSRSCSSTDRLAETAPQMLAHGEAFSPASVVCRGRRPSTWGACIGAGSLIVLSFPRDPFADVGRAIEQLGALPLALHQEVDDIDADYGHSLQVQDGAGTADLQLVRDLPEVLGLHGPDQPDGRSASLRAALDLERHPQRREQPAGHPLSSGDCRGPADHPSSNCPASAGPRRPSAIVAERMLAGAPRGPRPVMKWP